MLDGVGQQDQESDARSAMTSRTTISRAQTTQSRRDGVPPSLMGERDSIHRTSFSQLQQLPPPHSKGLLMGAWLLLLGRNSFLNHVPDDSDDDTAMPGSARLPSVKFAIQVERSNGDVASPTAQVNPLRTPPDTSLPPGSVNEGEDSMDDRHNTTIFIPLPVMLVILGVFFYCCVVVFWFPSSRPYSKGFVSAWTGGQMEAVEAALPFVAVGLYMLALSYANALSITFLQIEKQHVMDKRFVRQLRGKSITFSSKEAVQLLERINDKGLFVNRKVIEKIRQHGQRDQIPADVFARYISSLASIKARRQLRQDSVTGALVILSPLIIAISPWFPRIASGGAIWANAEVEEIAISILGPVLTFLSFNSVGTMIQTHAQTLSYHHERVARVSHSLPDPHRGVDHSWPTIPLDTILNVTLWNRVRWALSFPPNALHYWGTVVLDSTFVAFLGFMLIVCVTSIFNPPVVAFDGAMALMIALLLTYCPITTYLLYSALQTTQLEAENREALCRILLLTTRSVITSNTTAEQRHVQINKSQELRAAIRDVASSVADQLHPVRFLGRPVDSATFFATMLSFLAFLLLACLRAAFSRRVSEF